MGASASMTIPMHVDKDTFRRLTGGTFNDPIFDEFAIDGVMSRDKLMELAQTTDCFLSFDRDSTDIYGRSNFERVVRLSNGLRSRGLVTWLLEEQYEQDKNVLSICSAIDKTRSVLVFLTKNYVDRVVGPITTDVCQVEFNYSLRRKFPEKIITIVFEETFLPPSGAGAGAQLTAEWKGPVGAHLGGVANCIDGVRDEDFDQQLEALFQRVVKVTRSNPFSASKPLPTGGTLGATGEKLHSYQPPPPAQIPGLAPNATREEAQFFQWLARSCSRISDSKRVIYCAALQHVGVTTVHKLAQMMASSATFLMSVGITEHDADDIALAVSDLGLGYAPVRDFSNTTTIESAIYAMRKTCQATGDRELAASALACIARIANSDPSMPKQLSDKGICEPVVKVLSRNIGDPDTVEQAYMAMLALSSSDEIAERLGELSACDVVPRSLSSNLKVAVVVETGCRLVSLLSRLKANKQKLGTAGACDVVMRGLQKHFNSAGVAEQGCDAAYRLAQSCGENVGKLAYSNACETIPQALAQHTNNAGVAEAAFRAMALLSIEPANRSRMGASGVCEACVVALMQHTDNPVIVETGLVLMNTLIIGNASNRAKLGVAGACEVVTAVLNAYDPSQFPLIVKLGCTSVYSLASGSPVNQQKLASLQPVLTYLVRACPSGDQFMLPEAQEALLRITKS